MDDWKAKKIWVAWSNTDCIEGRGARYPIHYCEAKATALRLGKRKSIQGSTDVTSATVFSRNGHNGWYGPIHIIPPSDKDAIQEKSIEKHNKLVQKALDAGLTEDDIKALSTPQFIG